MKVRKEEVRHNAGEGLLKRQPEPAAAKIKTKGTGDDLSSDTSAVKFW